MPDDTSGTSVDGTRGQRDPSAQPVNAPPLPSDPRGADAKPISNDGMRSDIENLQDRTRSAEKWMIRLTAAIAYFGLCTVIAALLQWHVMSGQLAEMKSGGADAHNLATDTRTLAADTGTQATQTTTLAIATSKMVKNASLALSNTKRAFRTEQRAWVGVRNAVWVDFSKNVPWKVTVVFVNSGKDPARKVLTAARSYFSPTPFPGPSPQQINSLTFNPSQSIAPQQTFNLAVGFGLPTQMVTGSESEGIHNKISAYPYISSGKVLLYYYGELKYDDGEGHVGITQFCIYMIDPAKKQIGYCSAFNDLD